MDSSEENAAASKVCAQPAECFASPEIELKEAEDATAATALTEAVSEMTAKEPEISLFGEDAARCQSAGPTAPASGQNSESDASSAPRNLSLHASAIPLSIKPDMSTDWPLSRKRQFFNVFYFGLITLQLLALTRFGIPHWMVYVCLSVCGALTAASVFYLFNHRHHASSSDEFSPRVRRSLRAVALLVPAFMMFGFYRTDVQEPFVGNDAPVVASSYNSEMDLGKAAYKKRDYRRALDHFQRAASAKPDSDVAPEWIAETYSSMFDFQSAVPAGLHAIDLNPDNENAHVITAHALNMVGRFSESAPLAQKATELSPEDGEAYNYLGDAYRGLGQLENALAAYTEHVKYHPYESVSFRHRADILERLGRTAEARFDREMSEKVRASTHR